VQQISTNAFTWLGCANPAVTHLLHAFHGYRPGNRPEHTLEISAYHGFILGIHGGGIHLVSLSICARNNASRMLFPE
jgi:hypothetical protein